MELHIIHRNVPRRLLLAGSTIALLLLAVLVNATPPDTEVNVSVTTGYQGAGAVAVGRTDAGQLLVTAEDGAGASPLTYDSSDAGDNFTAGAALPLTSGSDTFATADQVDIAVDSGGTWYATYRLANVSGPDRIDTTVGLASSVDGITWTPLTSPRSTCCGGMTTPAIEQASLTVATDVCGSQTDTLYVVWVETSAADLQTVYFTRSTDGGSSWWPILTVSDATADLALGERLVRPRVAVGPDDEVHVSWLHHTPTTRTILHDVSTDGGVSFPTADRSVQTVTVGCDSGNCGVDLTCSGGLLHGSTPELAVDTSYGAARGTIYVAYADDLGGGNGMDVFVTSSTDDGTSWTTPTVIHQDTPGLGRHQYGPALAIDPTGGDLHATWYDRRDDGTTPNCLTEAFHARSADSGANWVDETEISSAASDYSGDANGEGLHMGLVVSRTAAHAVWTDSRSPGFDFELYAARIPKGASGTAVAGSITGSTTWNQAGSPYVLTGDVTVETGAILTINPGVEVRVAQCDEGSSGLIELSVEGELDAQGTLGEPIRFTSAATLPASADWDGLSFENTTESSDSTLDHVVVEYTQTAIGLTNASPSLSNLTLDQSVFGIQGSARTGTPFSPTDMTVDQAGSSAVSLTNVTGTWTGLTVTNSGDAGSLAGGNQPLRIVGAEITSNSDGLDLYLSGGTLEVIRSTFTSNAGGTGLTLLGNGPRTLVGNDIHGNTVGLVVSNGDSTWGKVSLHYNNLYANAGLDVSLLAGSLPVDARRNYWDPSSAAEIATYPGNVTRINDIHDVSSLRHVDYRLAQTTGPLAVGAQTGVNLESYLAVPSMAPDMQLRLAGGAVADAGIQEVRVRVTKTCGDQAVVFDQAATVSGAAFFSEWTPVPSADCGGAFPETFLVESEVTDLMAGVEAVADSRMITIVDEPTISGPLTGNETWMADRNGDMVPDEIVLEGDVTIPTAFSLTIEEGTIIRAHFLSDDTFSGDDPSRIELIAEGNLTIVGTQTDPVSFDSSRLPSGQTGDWYGIRFEDTVTDTTSSVHETDIDHATIGVELVSAAPDITDSRVRDSVLDGIRGSSGALSKSLWTLDGNTVTGNGAEGIDLVAQTAVRIVGGTYANNSSHGIALNSAPNAIEVRGITSQFNAGHGLRLTGGDDADAGTPDVRVLDSIVFNNDLDGIHVTNGGPETRIERVDVDQNDGNGVFAGSGTTVLLLASSITNNGRGVQIGSPRLVGAYNTITGNGGATGNGSGLLNSSSSGTPAVVSLSYIENDPADEVAIASLRSLNARRNWWGNTTRAEMLLRGYPWNLPNVSDIWDNPDRGHLDWSNPCPSLAACPTAGTMAAHVTFPAQGAVVDNTNLLVTGVAYAENGIDRVEISTNGSSWATATGKEAWSWVWQAAAESPTIQVRVCDDGMPSACSTPDETITFTVTPEELTTSGPIGCTPPCSETWGPGTVVLTGDVTVPAGITLNVLPATTIEALPNTDDRLGGEDTARIEVVVEGTLVANATMGNEVLWTSRRPALIGVCDDDGVTLCDPDGADCVGTCVPDPPTPRDWRAIRFVDSSDDAANLLRHVTVEAGRDGIEFRDSAAGVIDHVTSRLNSDDGLAFDRGSGSFPAAVTIADGDFSENGGTGVEFSGSSNTLWTLERTSLNLNTLGLDVVDAGGNFTLEDLTVTQNASTGLDLVSSNSTVGNVSLRGSTISDNGALAVNVSGADIEIFDNQIDGHATLAVSVTSTADVRIYGNEFGLVTPNDRNLSASAQTLSMVYNEFGQTLSTNTANVVGQSLVTTPVHFNNFPDSPPSWILRNDGSASVSAEQNWWGVSTTAEMNVEGFPSDISSLYDVEDDGSKGRMDYQRYRSLAEGAIDLSPARACGFANPIDGDLLTSGMGASFTLRGAATANVGVATVEIQIEDSMANIVLPWEEVSDGAIAWEYLWTPPAADTYTLTCLVTDRSNDEAMSSVSVMVSLGLTTSGTIVGTEIWTPAQGPIELTGDVTVQADASLTIEAGTEVRAKPGVDDQSGGEDSSLIELIVEGTLVLNGVGGTCDVTTTQVCLVDDQCPTGETCVGANPVTLSSNEEGTCSVTTTTACREDADCPPSETCQDGPAAGDWRGLILDGAAGADTPNGLQALIVEYADEGIFNRDGANPEIVNTVVRDAATSGIRFNNLGDVALGAGRTGVTITDTLVERIGSSWGIELSFGNADPTWDGSQHALLRNRVRDVTGSDAVYVAGYTLADPVLEFRDNLVEDSKRGLNVSGFGLDLQAYVIDNRFVNVGTTSFDSSITMSAFSSGSSVEIRRNTIDDSPIGIRLNGVNSFANWSTARILDNHITETPAGISLSCNSDCDAQIEHNVLIRDPDNSGDSGGTGMSLSSGRVVGNRITGFDEGVALNSIFGSFRSDTLLYNIISDNDSEEIDLINIDSFIPRLHWNHLRGDGGAVIRNGDAPSDARRNWWEGVAISSYPENLAEIIDIEDGVASVDGRTNYDGWLAGPLAIEGTCSIDATACVSDVECPTGQTCENGIELESRIVWPHPIERNGPAVRPVLPNGQPTILGTAFATEGIRSVELRIDTDPGGVQVLDWTAVDARSGEECSWDGVSTAERSECTLWEFVPPTLLANGVYVLTTTVTALNTDVATETSVEIEVNSAAPTTRGVVLGEETWSGTVQLVGDVTVPVGSTLTINQGTVVEIQPLADDEATQVTGIGSNDIARLNRIELNVEGTLVLNGIGGNCDVTTSRVCIDDAQCPAGESCLGAAPVIFTSSRQGACSITAATSCRTDSDCPPSETCVGGPMADDWHNLELDGASTPNEVQALILEYGTEGLQARSGTHPDIVNVVVRDMSKSGIEFSDLGVVPLDAGKSGVTITDTLMERLGSDGIRLAFNNADPSWDGSQHDFLRNFLRDLGSSAVSLQGSTLDDPVLEFRDNRVESSGTGLSLSSFGTRTRSHVSDNSFSTLASTAVYLQAFGDGNSAEVLRNTIVNSGTGVDLDRLNNGAGWATIDILDNVVTGTGTGIRHDCRAGDLCETRIERNTLSGGNTGMSLSRGRVVGNRITGFGSDGIFLGTAFGTNASDVVLYNVIRDNTGEDIDLRYVDSGRLHWNHLKGDGGTVIRNGTPPSDVRRNWWEGVTINSYPVDLDPEIHDIEDGGSEGRANYDGWLSGPLAIEGSCIIDATACVTDMECPSGQTCEGEIELESRIVWPHPLERNGPPSRPVLTDGQPAILGTAFATEGIRSVELRIDTDPGGVQVLDWTAVDARSGETCDWDGMSTARRSECTTWEFVPPTLLADGDYVLTTRVTALEASVETGSSSREVEITVDSTAPTTRGLVLGNETWSGTVQLVGDVTVPVGSTLTINPGTVIEIQPLADDGLGGNDENRIELIVDGTLNLEGTEMNPIVLTSSSVTPARGHWYGLRFADPAGETSTLSHCRIEYARWGLQGDTSSTGALLPDVSHCDFDNLSEDAIVTQLAGPYGRDKWSVTDSNFTNLDRRGIVIEGNSSATMDIEVTDVLIDNFGSTGLALSVGTPQTVAIDRTMVSSTANSGNMVELAGGSSSGGRATVRASLLDNGAASGQTLEVEQFAEVEVADTVISGGWYGVYCSGNGCSGMDLSILRSEIEFALYYGVEFSAFSPATLTVLDSSIRSNGSRGISIGSSVDATIQRNNLDNNGTYSLYNNGTNPVDARFNHWDATTTTEMRLPDGCNRDIGAIFDQFDSASRGLVTYCPFEGGEFGDVAELQVFRAPSGEEVRWTPKPPVTYDLIRATLSALSDGGSQVDLGAVDCLAQADASGAVPDMDGAPPAGEAWIYLLRDHDTPGTYGYASEPVTACTTEDCLKPRVPGSGSCPP